MMLERLARPPKDLEKDDEPIVNKRSRPSAPIEVGSAGSRAELEADRFATAFLSRHVEPSSTRIARSSNIGSTHETSTSSPRVQRSIDSRQSGEERDSFDAPEHVTNELQRRGPTERLDTDLRSSLEQHSGERLGEVRVQRSSALPEQVGATAFAYGNSIHFAPGSYQPNQRDGQALVAHEVAHVLQQRGTSPRINRFIAGTAAALAERGGQSKRVKRFARRSKSADPVWDRLVKDTTSHEQLEAKMKAAHRNASYMRAKDTQALVKSLDAVEATALKWKADPENDRLAHLERTGAEDDPYATPEAKQARHRFSLIEMLLPRVRLERQDVLAGRFITNTSYTDASLDWSKQAAVGGGINSLDFVSHRDKGGASSFGLFKQDRRHEERNVAVMDGGIDSNTGNWGARSVAMSRLDEVLGTNMMAKTDFSTHAGEVAVNADKADPGQRYAGSKAMIGTRQAAAPGKAMGDYISPDGFKVLGERAQAGAISFADPELQRLLSILQVVDAIAGQLDRHAGNFFIQTDPQSGRVTNVTGIDLDQAFAPQHTSVEAGNWSSAGFTEDKSHFKGVPAKIDKEFGLKLLKVPDDRIRYALEPLIPTADLDATMQRWRQVKAKIREMAARNELVEMWGEATAREQTDPKTSYLGHARIALFNRAMDPLTELYSGAGKELSVARWTVMITNPMLEKAAWYPDMTPDMAITIVHRIAFELLNNQQYLANRRRNDAATAATAAQDTDAKELLAGLRSRRNENPEWRHGHNIEGNNPQHYRELLDAMGLSAAEIQRVDASVAAENGRKTTNLARKAEFTAMFAEWVDKMIGYYSMWVGMGGDPQKLPAPPPPANLSDNLFPKLSGG